MLMQVEEQLHRSFVRDLYFLDNMRPSSHIFLMRSLIEVHNEVKNSHAVSETERKTGTKVSIDASGRLFTLAAGMCNYLLYI